MQLGVTGGGGNGAASSFWACGGVEVHAYFVCLVVITANRFVCSLPCVECWCNSEVCVCVCVCVLWDQRLAIQGYGAL